jgi:hypothetical protein
MNYITGRSHARFYSILYILFIGCLNTTQHDGGSCQKSKHVAEVLVNMLVVLDCFIICVTAQRDKLQDKLIFP